MDHFVSASVKMLLNKGFKTSPQAQLHGNYDLPSCVSNPFLSTERDERLVGLDPKAWAVALEASDHHSMGNTLHRLLTPVAAGVSEGSASTSIVSFDTSLCSCTTLDSNSKIVNVAQSKWLNHWMMEVQSQEFQRQ